MKKYLTLLFCCSSTLVMAQSHLDHYVQYGLANNQSLKQHQFALERSVLALQEARSLFLPRVTLMGDYFLAGGGRTVDFPAGDLLNPVYATLNQLTESNSFPTLENERILLNPDNFYDVKFRTTLPLLNAEIIYNQRIKSEMVNIQKLESNIYKRELVKDIKTAYFNYLQALQAVQIYESALKLVQENKRINESLFRNDMANRTVLIRTENELIRTQNQKHAAVQQTRNAQAYFNFLLNRPLGEEVLIDESTLNNFNINSDLAYAGYREELQQLTVVSKINQHQIGLSRSYLIPKVSSFLDLGSQGFDWDYNSLTRYYFFGLSLQWNVFAAGQNRNRVRQAAYDQKSSLSKMDQTAKQLEMALQISLNNFDASYSQYQGAEKQVASAQQGYDDSMKLYREGQLLFIELLDAQNQLIAAQLQQNIYLFDCHIKAAVIERANASFNLNSTEL